MELADIIPSWKSSAMSRECIGRAGTVIVCAATGVSRCSGMYWDMWVYIGQS